jgi:undecaprenyl diphosphate synthase
MIDSANIPKHIAIIMDGNGRWAREKGLPRTEGHRRGARAVQEVLRAAVDLEVKAVTLFAFSSENWDRPRNEIRLLMRYLENFLGKQLRELEKNDVRLLVIGRGDPLPKVLQRKIKLAEDRTRDNAGLKLVLALNYGARQEIVDAAKKICRQAIKKEIAPEDINENTFADYLYTAGIPEPDLLIRTSGEMRLSNFLLWQLSYAELYFPKKYWPDFSREDLLEAIRVYQGRERRFGGVRAFPKDT